MKVTRSVRLPADTLKGVAWLQRREGGDTSDVIRRMIRRGLEREMVELYQRGRVSLREMADILSISARDALDLLWRQGVGGNVSMEQALEALEVGKKLSGM